MKMFFDTEFTGLHQNTTLISLALVDEDNNCFYVEFNDFKRNQIDNWLQENVIKHLLFYRGISRDTNYTCFKQVDKSIIIVDNQTNIAKHLKEWLSNYDQIEMWSDCLSYDWVLFNNLFGTALDIPPNVYYIPFDICTLFKIKNIDPDINRENFADYKITNNKHNSLHDAKVIKACYEKLINIK